MKNWRKWIKSSKALPLKVIQTRKLRFKARKYIEIHCIFCSWQVYVSSSLANLYEGVRKKDWRLVYTGIPVLLHDKGSARSRTSPRVTFVLAERGTCFALWKDTIDNLSNYKVSGPAFHTMCLSNGIEFFQLKTFSNFTDYFYLRRSSQSGRIQFRFKRVSNRTMAMGWKIN